MEWPTDVRLHTNLLFNPPLFNGAGTCKEVEDVRKVAASPSGAVLCGSYTLAKRPFNEGETFWQGSGRAMNALGLPCHGKQYLVDNLDEMVGIAHDADKPFILSVAGETPEEYVELAMLGFEKGIDAAELNLGCGNKVSETGRRKPIPSYHPEMVGEILEAISDAVAGRRKIWLKVSPLPQDFVPDVAEIVNQFNCVTVVATINTWAGALALRENGGSRIGVGLAGLSAEAVFEMGLGQVFQWRRDLRDDIDIVGLGGISKAEHFRDYLRVGAAACAMTTALYRDGGRLDMGALESLLVQFETRLEGDLLPGVAAPKLL